MRIKTIIKNLCPYGIVKVYQRNSIRKSNKKVIVDNDSKQLSVISNPQTIGYDPSNKIINEKGDSILLDNCNITINGIDNIIQIHSTTKFEGNGKINIIINGNNNRIILGENNIIFITLVIVMGSCELYSIENSFIQFGKRNHIGGVSIEIDNSNASVTIGDDCQFADRVLIYDTDGHPIYNDKDQIINKVEQLSIGNNVWICEEALLLKNITIPDGCIVGRRAVVAGKGKFSEPNCAIAGNPARVVSRNVYWREYSKEYVENCKEKN